MSNPTLAAPRDASQYDRPDTRSRRRVHIAINGAAACSGATLDMHLADRATTWPEHTRCRRPSCRAHWHSAHQRENPGTTSK